MFIPADSAVVERLTAAIQSGDLDTVQTLIDQQPDLATAHFGDDEPGGMARTALHVATDWPGNFPDVARTIRILVEAGADVNARFVGPHIETPLHWAASSDDVDAIDALLAAGADLEAGGGVLTGGPPLDDAIIFEQRKAARRLIEHGAITRLFHAASMGLTDRVQDLLDGGGCERDEVTNALWHACKAGSSEPATLLLAAGGDPLWDGWDGLTPLAAAQRSGNAALAQLLEQAARH